MVQARIFQARRKRQSQLRNTANVFFVRGVKAAVTAVRELTGTGYNEIYDLESVVLHHLKVIDADHRLLRDCDKTKSHDDILESAQRLLPSEKPTDEQFITLAVLHARSANEAWVLHRELTTFYRDDLPDERRGKLSLAISEKFPD